MSMYTPLADLIRPKTLDEVVGQTHILGKNGMLRRIVESEMIPNMIFYGPSGTGKTTVADIIARRTRRQLRTAPRSVRSQPWRSRRFFVCRSPDAARSRILSLYR